MAERNRPFKIGLFVPHFELPWNGEAIRWDTLREMALCAEAVGFDSFWMPDHLLFRHPGMQQQGGWDAWSMLTGLAAITKRMEIAPLVACASFRNPALIAKMADTIDEISGGRFILGLGAGWHKPEYSAFGFPHDHRVSRFEEAIQIIRGLLKDGQIDFQGRFYEARECELRPRGPRPQGPPILVGGHGPRMLRITARYADYWNADRQNDLNVVKQKEAQLDEACREVGRDPATLGRVIGIQADLLNDEREAFDPRQFVMAPYPLAGSADDLAAQIRDFATAHVDHLIVWLDPVSPRGVEAFAPVLEALDRG